MKNTISFNTKFGWVSATEINQKITKEFSLTKPQNQEDFQKILKILKKC